MKKYLLRCCCMLAAFAFAACGGDDDVVDPPVTPPAVPEQPVTPDSGDPRKFAKGADVSWYTEMKADGLSFRDAEGTATELPQLLAQIGMNSVRLRVWVNPLSGYCNEADVVEKALAASRAGLEVMVDFHYSDFFADPSRQEKPNLWDGMTLEELKVAVDQHTRSVLTALKQKSVVPMWVQVGNETRNGMLWPEGQLWNDSGDLPNGWQQYAALSNAGYDAAKAIFPNTCVLVHLNNAWSDNDWWFKKFKAAGGKFDMIGLSHYPQEAEEDVWDSALNKTVHKKYTPEEANTLAVTQLKKLASAYGVRVMISEVGVWQSDPAAGKKILADFIEKLRQTSSCAGIFYWEPQVYGNWKPSIYNDLGWNAYNKGAFTAAGSPSIILDPFKE